MSESLIFSENSLNISQNEKKISGYWQKPSEFSPNLTDSNVERTVLQ